MASAAKSEASTEAHCCSRMHPKGLSGVHGAHIDTEDEGRARCAVCSAQLAWADWAQAILEQEEGGVGSAARAAQLARKSRSRDVSQKKKERAAASLLQKIYETNGERGV